MQADTERSFGRDENHLFDLESEFLGQRLFDKESYSNTLSLLSFAELLKRLLFTYIILTSQF
jgi:hypothetical protein